MEFADEAAMELPLSIPYQRRRLSHNPSQTSYSHVDVVSPISKDPKKKRFIGMRGTLEQSCIIRPFMSGCRRLGKPLGES